MFKLTDILSFMRRRPGCSGFKVIDALLNDQESMREATLFRAVVGQEAVKHLHFTAVPTVYGRKTLMNIVLEMPV
jgi:hypothetical protein